MSNPSPFPVTLIFRPLLTSGLLSVAKDNSNVTILIDSEQEQKEQLIALWHELIHVIQLASGHELNDIDEDLTEMVAARWAEACPELLSLCKNFGACKAPVRCPDAVGHSAGKPSR